MDKQIKAINEDIDFVKDIYEQLIILLPSFNITDKKIYYINIKIHNVAKRENKNDIAAVEKLYMQYSANPSYNLIYACFGIAFRDINIRFDPDYLCLFSPQFLPIYVNPRNDKIQAYYHHKPIYRTRTKFLEELRINSKSIVLIP